MNLSLRHSIAATAAATVLTALGAFATMSPASAMPADAGSPGTLSGNIVHTPTSKLSTSRAADNVTVTPIGQGDIPQDAICAWSSPVTYCEQFTNGVNAGVSATVYIGVNGASSFDATVDINDGGWEGTDHSAPVHATSSYVAVSFGTISPYTDAFAIHVPITLDGGQTYLATGTETLATYGNYTDPTLSLNPA
jgi:hypothetical protein